MYAVVPAGGNSSRMNPTGSESKLLMALSEQDTVLSRTLKTLAGAQILNGIAVAARTAEIETISQMLNAAFPAGDNIVVAGGETRQESVFNALSALRRKASWVLVHDAARPCCPAEKIREAAEYCRDRGACILAVPVKPTLKRVTGGAGNPRLIAATLDRSEIWEAQTPQAFPFAVLMAAAEQARADGYRATDCAELVERSGIPVAIIEGADCNIKITTPADLEIARSLLDRLSPERTSINP